MAVRGTARGSRAGRRVAIHRRAAIHHRVAVDRRVAIGGTGGLWRGTAGGGRLYLAHSHRMTVVSGGRVVRTLRLDPASAVGDWDLFQGSLYGLSGTGRLVKVNPTTGKATSVPLPPPLPRGSMYGATFVTGGVLYAVHNATHRLVRVPLAALASATVVATLNTTGAATDRIDGTYAPAPCPTAPAPEPPAAAPPPSPAAPAPSRAAVPAPAVKPVRRPTSPPAPSPTRARHVPYEGAAAARPADHATLRRWVAGSVAALVVGVALVVRRAGAHGT